jgi:mycothiol synthase
MAGMAAPLELPDGYTQRSLVPEDAAAVTAAIAAQEVADVGEVVIEEADIVADWQRPGYDIASGTLGVFYGDVLAAYADVGYRNRCDAAVHPDHRGRGIGTQIARWMQERAREQGWDLVGMPVPEGSPGDVLLESLGYHVRWYSWVLQLPEGATIPERPLPDGYSVRAADESEHEAAYHVTEDAFLEWAVRERESFEAWQSQTVLRPGFEPWNLRVVTDPSGEVVATALVQMNLDCGYIARLATRKDQRGQGLAQALLVDAFAAAAEHGAVKSELSTDSRTGALGLYEKVGMEVTSTWVSRAINLGPAS